MHQYNTFFTLRSVLPYNRLRFINIRIILENLDFQAYRIFLQTDQSLHTTQAYKIIRMCRKDCSQFMKVDSCKLRIMVQESKREVENSNQRKNILLPSSPSVKWMCIYCYRLKKRALAVQQVKTRLLNKECPLNWWLMNPWVFTI